MRIRSPEYLWARSRWLHHRGCKRSARVVKMLNWIIHKCLLPAEAEVGHDLILEHYALGVVVHPQVKIGDRVRIYHHVTIASESSFGSPHFVILNDDCVVGAHSIIIGKGEKSLTVGRKSIVGAGSVLTKSVPDGEIWAGNPARFLSTVLDRNNRLYSTI